MVSSYRTKREKYEVTRVQLENDRSSFIPTWREVSDYLSPRRARFSLSEVNRGDRRNQKIIDSTGTLGLRTLRSGMMSGITNKARPWFRLTTPDPSMAEISSVKEWLHQTTTDMLSVMLRSNIYKTFGGTFADTAGFATGTMYIERNLDRVIHTQSFPIGSYCIGADRYGRVNVFFREFRMTVRQLIDTFGREKQDDEIDWSKFSTHVKRAWQDGHRENWVDVCHIIMPNDEHDPKKGLSRYKPFISCYYERGVANGDRYSMANEDTYLSEMGYDYFPILCFRWETTGEDVWGTNCPGIESIGDIKALQVLQRRKAEAIERMNRPPIKASSSLKSSKASIIPGDITYVDEMAGQNWMQPVYQVDPRIQEMLLDIQDHQNRIKRAFYEDILLMISGDERADRTAYEIEARKEEKLTVLGPVLESIDEELDKLIDILFFEMNEQGLISPPPEELQGQKLKVEYISVMHQAMKLVGVSGMERFVGNISKLSVETQNPSLMDKIDTDQFADVYGDHLSVNPSIIRSDEKVEKIRAQREKRQQAQAMAEQAEQMANTAQKLGSADMSGDNALTRLAQGGQGQIVQ